MGYPMTNLIQPIGTQSMQASGSTQGIQLSNLALRGLSLLVSTKPTSGNTAEGIAKIAAEITRIRVNVDGADDYNIAGQSLRVMNRKLLDGEDIPSVAQATGGNRVIALYLPFEMVGGMKSTDTLLDLRPRANGSLPQAYVQFDTALTASHAGSIRVFEHYYNLGSKQRKTAFRKQLIQKTLTVTAGGSFVLPIDYGAPMDDIARMYCWIANADGEPTSAPVFRQVKLTASEGTQYDVFDLVGDSADNYSGIPWVFNRLGQITDDADFVVEFNFLSDNSKGNSGKLSGVLSASLMSNLVLSGVAGQAGTLHVVIERVNVGNAGADPYAT